MSSIPTEASQLAILASDASEHDKAVACQMLVYVGGQKSVAPLAALLTHEHLADYARSGLEAIEDPAASEALLKALTQLKAPALGGIVNSLGVRREAKAVTPLKPLAAGPKEGVQSEAIAALGLIGTPEATQPLIAMIEGDSEPQKTEAAHAAIIAAEHLAREGQAELSKQVAATLKSAFPKGPIHAAAERLA